MTFAVTLESLRRLISFAVAARSALASAPASSGITEVETTMPCPSGIHRGPDTAYGNSRTFCGSPPSTAIT